MKYQIQYLKDDDFWPALANLPQQRDPNRTDPYVLKLRSIGTFYFHPYDARDGFLDDTIGRGLHLLVPPTPAPITTLSYLFAPQVGAHRRLFAAFSFAANQALLAEVPVPILLQTPLGLRLPPGAVNAAPPGMAPQPSNTGAVNTQFRINPIILKGDEAPVHVVLVDPKNEQLGFMATETPEYPNATSPTYGSALPSALADPIMVLKISAKLPGMATAAINTDSVVI